MNKSLGHNFQYSVEDRVRANGWETESEVGFIDDVELKNRPVGLIYT